MLTAVSVHFWGLNGAVFAILTTEIMSFSIFNYFYKDRIILDVQREFFYSSHL